MNIKVLVTPHCSGCKIVKGYLNEMNIKYEVIDMMQNPDILQKYPTMSAPTIVINEKVEFIGTPNKEELKKMVFKGE
ncbi:MAG: thioredoxin family protein [Nanoarchaeota archaeon]